MDSALLAHQVRLDALRVGASQPAVAVQLLSPLLGPPPHHDHTGELDGQPALPAEQGRAAGPLMVLREQAFPAHGTEPIHETGHGRNDAA